MSDPVFTFSRGYVRRYGCVLTIRDAYKVLANFEADARPDADWFRHRARELADELIEAINQYERHHEEVAA